MWNIENLWDKANTNGFSQNPQNIAWKWRPPSFKKQFEKILESDWEFTFWDNQIIEINKEDGYVRVKVTQKEAMVLKALNWAMSHHGMESTKMIKWIVEMFEWKATQRIEGEIVTENSNPLKERLLALEERAKKKKTKKIKKSKEYKKRKVFKIVKKTK